MTPPKPRMQSQTERDLAGIQARKERESQSAAPTVEISGEITGNYTGPELLAMRSKRGTDERIGRLEEKHDTLVETVTEVRLDVREMRAEVRTLVKHVEASLSEQHKTERVRIDSRTKLMIAVVGAVGTAIGVIVTALSGCA